MSGLPFQRYHYFSFYVNDIIIARYCRVSSYKFALQFALKAISTSGCFCKLYNINSYYVLMKGGVHGLDA